MRYFTPQEANDFLPALREAFGRIDHDRSELLRIVSEVEDLGHAADLPLEPDSERSTADLPAPVRQRLVKARILMGRIRRIVGELQAHGLLVKRLDGLVDFGSLRGERPVFLCWRKGEKQIDHWHEVSSDYDGRRPVDNLFKPSQLN
jgi:hypothetical protein